MHYNCLDGSFYLFVILGFGLYNYVQYRQQAAMNEEQFLEMFRNIQQIDQNNEENVEEELPEAEQMPNEDNQLRHRQHP